MILIRERGFMQILNQLAGEPVKFAPVDLNRITKVADYRCKNRRTFSASASISSLPQEAQNLSAPV